jgi:hypothetical protein
MKVVALVALAVVALGQRTDELCQPCHAEQVSDFKEHPHFRKGLSCDLCHGKSEKHMKAVGGAAPDRVAAPDEVPALCGTCHSAQHKEYLPTAHAKLVLARARTKAPNCGACHGVHGPRNARAQCSRCHMEIPQAAAPGHGVR